MIPQKIPPPDPTEGNDDKHTRDEDNFPYPASPGDLKSIDGLKVDMLHATGTISDIFVRKYHFREFVSLNIGNDWYRISDFKPWRFHISIRKNANDNWVDDGSVIETNNNDW